MDLCWQSNVSILFNILSRFVIDFLPRSKCLLISWLQSLSAVILKPKKIKSFIVSIVSPYICHVRLESMILVFWMLNLSQIDGRSHKWLTKNTWTFSPTWLILDRFLPYDRHLKDFPGDSDGRKETALMQETQVWFLGGETWL